MEYHPNIMSPKSNSASQSMTSKVYTVLRREILCCQIVPSQALSEGGLAARFKISKTPVREALAKLRSDGLVKTFPRRGYQVAPVTFQDLSELFDLRMMLEGRAAELASQKITPEGLDRLTALTDIVYDRATQPSIERFVQANHDFHETIALASGNRRLHDMVVQVLDDLKRFFYLGAWLRDVGGEASNSHRQIIKALRKRDGDLARQSVVEEIQLTQNGLAAALMRQATSVMELRPVAQVVRGKASRPAR